MSFSYSPYGREIKLTTEDDGNGGTRLKIDNTTDNEITPQAVDNWLIRQDWVYVELHPQTGQKLYRKPYDSETENFLYNWHEAVAFQMYKFMSIGGENN